MFKHAFYNGRAPGAKLAHKGILVVSDPEVHIETIYSDKKSFSSEFGIGPRFKDINYSHPERWEIVEFPFVTPEMEAESRRKAELWNALRVAGLSKYDTRGALGCTLTGRHNPWDVFCSEVGYDVLPSGLIIPVLNFKMHPHRLRLVDAIIIDLNSIS